MSERICSVAGCDLPSRARGWCRRHYERAMGHGGDPGVAGYVRDGRGEWATAWGYRQAHWPDHPLANDRGTVLVHRAVLFDKIGPGTHRCNWCETSVAWNVDLLVDHLDWDRVNNDPANLVPSCSPCNSARAGFHKRGEDTPMAKLTEAAVIFVRKSRQSQRSLAAQFGVSRGTISAAQRGISWAHLPGATPNHRRGPRNG